MVRLIVYNIEYCEGIKGRPFEYLEFWRNVFPPKDLDLRIIENLKELKPDILSLIEVDTGSFRAGKDEVAFFRKKLDLKYSAEKVKYPSRGWLKVLHHIPILGKQANAIISKNKLSNIKYHVLNEGVKRVVIEATVSIPKKVTLLLAHLALGKKTREKQINELIDIVKSTKHPTILMGDFNTFNGEKEILNLLEQTHLKHKYKIKKHSRKMTFPTFRPRRRLDYVLTSKQIKVKNYQPIKFEFSDHLPLLVDFEVK